MVAPQPTLTKAIQRLDRAGLVERRSNDRDLRETVAHSTPAGRALAARLIERALEHERTWLRDSSPAEVALFKRMLHAIIERGHAPHPLLAA